MIALILSLTLSWSPYPSNDLATFLLYQGSASGVYTNVTLVATNGLSLNLNPGRYCFTVTAVNTNGLESLPSNELTIDVAQEVVFQIQIQASTAISGPWSNAWVSTWTNKAAPGLFYRAHLQAVGIPLIGPTNQTTAPSFALPPALPMPITPLLPPKYVNP